MGSRSRAETREKCSIERRSRREASKAPDSSQLLLAEQHSEAANSLSSLDVSGWALAPATRSRRLRCSSRPPRRPTAGRALRELPESRVGAAGGERQRARARRLLGEGSRRLREQAKAQACPAPASRRRPRACSARLPGDLTGPPPRPLHRTRVGEAERSPAGTPSWRLARADSRSAGEITITVLRGYALIRPGQASSREKRAPFLPLAALVEQPAVASPGSPRGRADRRTKAPARDAGTACGVTCLLGLEGSTKHRARAPGGLESGSLFPEQRFELGHGHLRARGRGAGRAICPAS